MGKRGEEGVQAQRKGWDGWVENKEVAELSEKGGEREVEDVGGRGKRSGEGERKKGGVSDTTSSRETRQIKNLLSEPSGADGGFEADGEREEDGKWNRKQ
jgi:hypothetical protein